MDDPLAADLLRLDPGARRAERPQADGDAEDAVRVGADRRHRPDRVEQRLRRLRHQPAGPDQARAPEPERAPQEEMTSVHGDPDHQAG
jgi:hypothetical protein